MEFEKGGSGEGVAEDGDVEPNPGAEAMEGIEINVVGVEKVGTSSNFNSC